MERENNLTTSEKKSNLKIIIITVIICLLLCIPIGILIGTNLANNDNTSKEVNNNPKEKEEIKEQELDLTSDKAVQAINTTKQIYVSDLNLYASNEYNFQSISNYDLVASAIRLMDQSYINFCVIEATVPTTLEHLNNGIKSYLEGKTITLDTITSLEKQSSYTAADYEVNSFGLKIDGNNIYVVGPCGAIFSAQDYIKKKTVKVTEKEEYVYVYEKHAFASYVESEDIYADELYANYYNTFAKDNAIIETLPTRAEENTEPNWSLYNTYKYTLKKHDNGYYLEKFELVK